MLVDTHCHLNIMVKSEFDIPLTSAQVALGQSLIEEAKRHDVTTIINVGTNVVESENCILLSRTYKEVYATVGIHPTDCTSEWKADFLKLKKMVIQKEENKIVGIGECGMDKFHKGYDFNRQRDVFKAQIELALEHNLALVIHSRDAADETLTILEEYRGQIERATMHCFSYDKAIAQEAINMGCVLGIGGTITYPKNKELRDIVATLKLATIVLETDAPFLPPQIIRGKQNHPLYIKFIAEYIAQLRNESFETIATQTTRNAFNLFGLAHLRN